MRLSLQRTITTQTVMEITEDWTISSLVGVIR
jgi:hypothetical protein